jgi:ubiquinone/menaquinone biosynthesis C-methylase UbiE
MSTPARATRATRTTASATTHHESAWGVVGAHIYDAFIALGEQRGMAAGRAALLADAEGAVLEIGAGTGANLAAYPPVDRLVLSEPAATMRGILARRVAREGTDATVVDAGAEALPVATGSIDTVVSTMVLCTVPDLEAALAEVARVLKPGGRLLFIEHVHSPVGSPLRRWQDRLAEPWAAFAMGCRCDRDIVGALRHHLDIEEVHEDRWLGMPPVVRPLVVGAATPRKH